jgi:hypothetical protein
VSALAGFFVDSVYLSQMTTSDPNPKKDARNVATNNVDAWCVNASGAYATTNGMKQTVAAQTIKLISDKSITVFIVFPVVRLR